MDGDDAIKALAEKVDALLGTTAAGVSTVTVSAATSGQSVITFPAGRFAAAPSAVLANPKESSIYLASTATYTATTFTALARRADGTSFSGTVTFAWIARS
jgi:hypothetical protein